MDLHSQVKLYKSHLFKPHPVDCSCLKAAICKNLVENIKKKKEMSEFEEIEVV